MDLIYLKIWCDSVTFCQRELLVLLTLFMAFKATLDMHLRSFQFKIINRILITNR